MKKMTKIFGTILAASAIFAVASCDGTENSLPVSVSENTSVESIVDVPTSENDKTSDSSISEETKEYEDVLYSLKADAFEAGKFSSPTTKGQFTLEGEVRGRTKQWINPNNKEETIDFTKSFKNGPITVLAPGNGTLSMYLQNGSSGAASQFVKVTTTIGEESTSESIEFSGATKAIEPYSSGSPVVRIDIEVKEGATYKIERGNGGTIDWYQIDMTCKVEKSSIVDFEIEDAGTVDYIVDQKFDSKDLSLVLKYGNGRTEVIGADNELVKIDSTAFDNTKAGVYPIKVKYGDFEEKTYNVNVYAVESIKLGFNQTYTGSKTAAGNTPYINGKVKTIYGLNEKLDTKYLTVTAIAKLNDTSKEFIVKTDSPKIEFSGFDSTKAGENTVQVSYKQGDNKISSSYKVTVTDIDPVLHNDEYAAVVDQNFDGLAGTVVSGYIHQFKTIGEALEFFSRSNIDQSKKKEILLNEGVYKEKLEITVPNLYLVGLDKDKVKIEWDSLYGIPDESGYMQVTDSTQTVAIRESAVNCNIANITISNYWNSESVFNSKENLELLKKYGLYTTKVNEHRALALLVQSDKFLMKNCSLLGYQDTVEFFKGRQYIDSTYIAGTTDFIFGTNNTTLFNNCEIHTIYNGQTNGGYQTAFKGCSSGEADSVDYGAIFYKCNFTKDEQITTSNTALGRTWGSYAAVAFIECDFDSHISKAASTGASQNERYVAMNNSKPTDKTVKFVEYGNTGAGAVNETIAGMTYLTEDSAKNYSDFSVIFGKTNGHVAYLDSWAPGQKIEVNKNTTYYFYNQSMTDGKSYVWDVEDTTYFQEDRKFGDLTIHATPSSKAGFNANANSLNMKSGATITLDVKANTTVTVVTYGGNYNKFTINGFGLTGDSGSITFTEDTTVTIASYGDSYLKSIVVSPLKNGEQPEEVTLKEIKVLNAPANPLIVGEDYTEALSNITVRVIYSNGLFKDVTTYTTDAETAINKNEANTYTVKVTYEGKEAEFDVTYVASVSDTFDETSEIDFSTSSAIAQSLKNNKITYNENFTYNDHGDSIQLNTENSSFSFKVKKGAEITVYSFGSGYGYLLINGQSNDSANKETFTAEDDMTVTISSENHNGSYSYSYLKKITVTYKTVISENTSLLFGSTDGNYATAKDFNISATVQDHGGNDSKLYGGSITFTVAAGAKVEVYANWSADYTINGKEVKGHTADMEDKGQSFYEYAEETEITIDCDTDKNGDNYFYWIKVTF